MLLLSADFFKIIFFKKICQEHYQSVKQFGSRLGFKPFAKVIRRQQKSPLARKELNIFQLRSN